MSTTVYVVTNTNHPDVAPFVFANEWDAIAYTRARWPADEDPGDGVSIVPQMLIDHDLTMTMIADELDDQDAAHDA